jgi:NADH-quinone oxidoreductase subunit N
MLCASADDLIWLFLALELTSLPTYIMVTISTRGTRSQEAGVKYFFLGALGAAVFLYGFALLYGASGSTDLVEIAGAFRAQAATEAGLNPIAIAGLAVSIIGLCFKIAAVPMHMYAADVYQGAASGVSAMLAFVPKAAGSSRS